MYVSMWGFKMNIETMRRLKDMREVVKKELIHIPRRNFDQNMFRQAYWSLRLHSLGKKGGQRSKEEVLVDATRLIRKESESFCPHFDSEFFDQEKLAELSKSDPSVAGCFVRRKI